jgi:hypothetical protein
LVWLVSLCLPSLKARLLNVHLPEYLLQKSIDHGCILHHVALGIVNYLTYYLTLYFQAVQGYSTLLAGVTTLPQPLTLSPRRWLLVLSPREQGNGIGALFPAHSLAVEGSVPKKHIAIAIVMSSFFQSFGQAVGIAVGGVNF